MRGDDPATFQRALGAALGEVELVREVQRAYDPDAAQAAALAAVAPIAAPDQTGGWNSPPAQQAPQQQYAPPAAPQGPSLPATLSKYNQLIPGLPTQPCAVCQQTAYPVAFQSKAGKSFKKYKCGVDDKNHDNPWI